MTPRFRFEEIVDSGPENYDIRTRVPGPAGALPITAEMLRQRASGDLFGWTQNAGMGWDPAKLGGSEVLLLSTHGGIRAADGTPVALGFHTGHWEVGLLMQAAAEELKAAGAVPFAGCCTDPCDGRTQGTAGMFDSLPYRNDAAIVFRRLIRSLPTRRAAIGFATCDKGLPAMMMALAGTRDLPAVLVPGGVALLAEDGEDTARVQTIGVRFAHGQITLEEAARAGCSACASPGGGCQFLGTAATSQVVGEALGMSLTHSALAPSGQPIWLDMARRSARAALELEARGIPMRDIVTEAALGNAMVTHAAFGGSTNLILHLAAIAHAAGLGRPTAADWAQVNRRVPRLVDALPNAAASTSRGARRLTCAQSAAVGPRRPAACAMAARCRIRLVDPPKAAWVTMALCERGFGDDVAHGDAAHFPVRAPPAPSGAPYRAKWRVPRAPARYPQRHSQSLPHHLRCGRLAQKLEPPPGNAQALQPEAGRLLERDIGRVRSAPRWSARGYLRRPRQQRTPPGTSTRVDRACRPAPSSSPAGLCPGGKPSPARRVGSERITAKDDGGDVAVRQRIDMPAVPCVRPSPGVGAAAGEGHRARRFQLLGRLQPTSQGPV